MNSTKARYLLDLNALIFLADTESPHYAAMHHWFDTSGKEDWGVCPLTEAGFVRVTTNPAYGGANRTIAQASAILAAFTAHPGYRYWPIAESWSALTAQFSTRLLGHQQVTDAYLLGLAVKHEGVLVTFDRGIKYLTGSQFSHNLLVLG
ncbi:MAG TPA: TA system VapC family ribonuclease toxin [Terracidiphilus sp.]|nr:TA system VapC family ribonuclease toxin [Terracidiphilus sp.]